MASLSRVETGVEGLDRVLFGGLRSGRSYMLRGGPGTGKTILGVHFLTTGVAAGESTLFVNFEEPTEHVRENLSSLGFDLSDVSFLDLTADAGSFTEDRTYGLFGPEETEAGRIADRISEAVDRVEPDRVFVDPLTQFRQLVSDDTAFRREATAFMRYLTDSGATVLFTTQSTPDRSVDDLEYLCDGSIRLGHGETGRTLEVTKFRGSDFQAGTHTARITDDGLRVYPRLEPEIHAREFTADTVSSGVDALDSLLSGGIERGTVSVISGPSGVGKTTTGSHFMKEAATRGERSVIYMFEESTATFRHRSRTIGVPVDEMIDEGSLAVEEVEPLSVSPDEFAAQVRTEVEERDARVVMLDGISGYRLSLRGAEDDLVRELHALCRYLRNMGVTVILVDDVGTVTGEFTPTSSRISYLADTILFLRYIEVAGELRKAAGVLKKRASDFERTLREFAITNEGIVLGDPLTGLRGILTGTPDFVEDD
ncbi:ATPase domain-containing protein [Halopenitus persicus]|uniref:ATPase domain-containing protein n=1 Tax=Halopenitus persicus TaxID=1048396 RepID=UPI000BBB35CC|nr:ATPase domain-containing protein [Halopenitus persicus]